MATMYFCTGTGNPYSANAVTGEDGVSKGVAVKATNAPDNIAEWRMTYNFSTNSVDVYGGLDKTDDEATQQQKMRTQPLKQNGTKKKQLELLLCQRNY